MAEVTEVLSVTSTSDTTGSADPIGSITINISGGNILNDVFGGGRGGVDKVCHTTRGGISWSDAYQDFTGKSEVYANTITINMTGGTVDGSIYGGGESVPWLDGHVTGNDVTSRYNVASVHATVSVNVSGGSVAKNVYGGGKGIDADDTSVKYVPKIIALKSTGDYAEVNWLSQTTYSKDDYTLRSDTAKSVYATYALVYGNIAVNISGTEIKTTAVGENVYGGGAIGLVGASGNDYSLTVNIQKYSSVAGSVYGAGKGTSTSDSLGQVYGHTSVTVGGTVLGNIYGGGAYGQLTGYTSVSVAGTVGINGSESNGNVYGGGQGLDSSLTLGKVGGNAVVKISGTAKGNVYGGGAYGQVTGSTEVTVTGTVGTEGGSYGNVFGAGQGSTAGVSDAVGQVGSVVKVLIDGSGLVYGNVYGGGAYGNISKGDTTVTVNSNATVKGSVYGGGQGASGGETWTIDSSSTDSRKVITQTYTDSAGKTVTNTYNVTKGSEPSHSGYSSTTVNGVTVYYTQLDTEGKQYSFVMVYNGAYIEGSSVAYSDSAAYNKVLQKLSEGIKTGGETVSYDCSGATVTQIYVSTSASGSATITVTVNSSGRGHSYSDYTTAVSGLEALTGYNKVDLTDIITLSDDVEATLYQNTNDGSLVRFAMHYSKDVSSGWWITYYDTVITCTASDYYISGVTDAIEGLAKALDTAIQNTTASTVASNFKNSPYPDSVSTSGSLDEISKAIASSSSVGSYGYVPGSATVTIDGKVEKNVYGGGAFGAIGGSTTVTVSGTVGTSGSETDGNVYGGGQGLATSNTLGKVGGDATVSISGSALGNVYGGGAYGIVTGSTGVTVAGTGKVGTEGGNYGNVYGAGQGVASSSDLTIGEVATVTGVTIKSGAKVYNSVYGGGAHGRVTSDSEIPVTVESGATVYKNVYGGGFGSETYTEGDGYVAGSAKVTIAGIVKGNVYGGGAFGVVAGSTDVIVSGTVGTSGSETDGNVYGGGQGVASGSDSKIGQVTTVTEVSIKSGAIIYNSVYGGGAHGNVTSGAKIPVTIESGATVYKNVFGGGYGDSTQYNVNDGYVAGSTEVTIAGTVKGNVYGGGGYGVVEGATSVSVTGTVDGTVYGGGFGFAGEKSNQGATVTITGGKVGSNVYGGARNGKSEGNTSVTITSATVGGTVYGGGLGSVGVTSVTGTSSVTVTSSNISGSVYGAAENGIVGTEGATVDQTSSVVLDSTKVGENVFGGGVGELGKVSVYGKTSVEVKGTTEIGGSVYGAAKNGYVTSSQVTITSGTVKGDVYGAGLGDVYDGKIQVSVTGDVAVTMSGGTVEGLLYGGAAYGQVQGSITITLSGGTIENTVYAGGKGTTGYVSVNGSRKIHLCGTKINGSLYGGSALGTDANLNNKDAKDSYA